MHLNAEIPWERYALIADLIKRFHDQGTTLRKTALQKLVFLLQRVFTVDCDYGYTLYTYGPYCADLARDLDIVEGLGGAEVTYDGSCGGYEIRPGSTTDELRGRAADFLDQIAEPLDRLIADYGRSTAKDLELRSTIIYLAKPGRSTQELVRMVNGVKPHFTEAQIDVARRELEQNDYLAGAIAQAHALTAAR